MACLRTLVVDIGGTHVKVWKSRHAGERKFSSGKMLTPLRLIERVKEISGGHSFDRISIGYPGPVIAGRPVTDPINLGAGWVEFDYWNAFGCPLRIMNDACMQALGGYEGGRMLYLGLGTGIGTAFIIDDVIVPLSLGQLRFLHQTFDGCLNDQGLKAQGVKRWRHAVLQAAADLKAAFLADYVVFGGGNAKKLDDLPENYRKGGNHNAYFGGLRMWDDRHRLMPLRAAELALLPNRS